MSRFFYESATGVTKVKVVILEYLCFKLSQDFYHKSSTIRVIIRYYSYGPTSGTKVT